MFCTMMAVVSIVGGYVFTSLLLFKYPNIIHRRKDLKFRCRHISHRGGAGENLENTLTAFEHATAMGTDMLEIDVQLTKDSEVVVSHDNNLYRSTGKNVNISELDYNELPQLKTQLPVDFDSGILFYGTSDRRIPLLKEVYAKFPTMPINIDIKTDSDDLIKKVSEMTKKYRREEFTVWGNVSEAVLNKCYQENPNMPIFFSFRRVIRLILLTYTGLLPFINLRESCLEIFMPQVIYKNQGSIMHQRKGAKAILWAMKKLLMRKAIFEHLDKRGIQTYLWVLNEDDEFQAAFDLGVTGVMTDYPTKLRDFLNKNPQYLLPSRVAKD